MIPNRIKQNNIKNSSKLSILITWHDKTRQDILEFLLTEMYPLTQVAYQIKVVMILSVTFVGFQQKWFQRVLWCVASNCEFRFFYLCSNWSIKKCLKDSIVLNQILLISTKFDTYYFISSICWNILFRIFFIWLFFQVSPNEVSQGNCLIHKKNPGVLQYA